jgi:hypothetical protein
MECEAQKGGTAFHRIDWRRWGLSFQCHFINVVPLDGEFLAQPGWKALALAVYCQPLFWGRLILPEATYLSQGKTAPTSALSCC